MYNGTKGCVTGEVEKVGHSTKIVGPPPDRQHSVVEIDHEMFSTVIFSLPLIQERQLSVSGERMCMILVNHLEYSACPVNVWLAEMNALHLTPVG